MIGPIVEEKRKYQICGKTSTAQYYALHYEQPGPLLGPYLEYSYESVARQSLGSQNPGTTIWKQVKHRYQAEDYHYRLQHGLRLPDLPYRYELYATQPAKCVWSQPLQQVGSQYYKATTLADMAFYVPWQAFPTGQPLQADMARLKSRLVSKQRGSTWNAPVFLAEGRKTSAMVAQRARDLVAIALAAKQGRLDVVFRALRAETSKNTEKVLRRRYKHEQKVAPSKAASNLLLETRYGWIPFVKDVYDAVEALQDMSERMDPVIGRTRASVRVNWQAVDRFDSDSYGIPGGQFVDYRSHADSRRAVWFWRIKPESIPARLGLLNPLVVLHELTPLSFVGDWFLPLGTYFSHLDLPFSVEHVGGTYGLRRKTVFVRTLVTHPTESGYWFNHAGTCTTDITYVERSAMTELPSLDLADLKVSAKLNSLQTVSAIALLRQRFR